VGIATGIAGLGAVFQHAVTTKTMSALAASAPGREVVQTVHGRLAGALVSGGTRAIARSLAPGPRRALEHAYRVGFTDALGEILLIGAAVALAGSLLALALVRTRDFVAQQAPEGTEATLAEPVAG
jgi:hypothetical protein